MRARRSPVIELPLKITLTTAGVEWFIRNKRQLKQLRMADSRLEYGISVATMSATALQKMINIDYTPAPLPQSDKTAGISPSAAALTETSAPCRPGCVSACIPCSIYARHTLAVASGRNIRFSFLTRVEGSLFTFSKSLR